MPLFRFTLVEFIAGHGDVADELTSTVQYVYSHTADDVVSAFDGGTSYMYSDVSDLVQVDSLPADVTPLSLIES